MKPRRRLATWPPRSSRSSHTPCRAKGVWKPTGPPVDGGPPVLVTTFRTEFDYPRIVAYVAWFDHTRTALAFYPGRYEPPNAPVRGPMSVPHGQRWRLLATFNSGFTYIDGHNGSSINGRSYEPLKDGLATLVGYRNGRVDVTTWSGRPERRAADRVRPPEPAADHRGRKAQPGAERQLAVGTARSATPSASGGPASASTGAATCIYAAADDQTVITLAKILQRAGAVRAMQFDINPEWPTLITYHHQTGSFRSRSCPNVMQPATRYLVPDDRDFFAVYRRLTGPITVPFK